MSEQVSQLLTRLGSDQILAKHVPRVKRCAKEAAADRQANPSEPIDRILDALFLVGSMSLLESALAVGNQAGAADLPKSLDDCANRNVRNAMREVLGARSRPDLGEFFALPLERENQILLFSLGEALPFHDLESQSANGIQRHGSDSAVDSEAFQTLYTFYDQSISSLVLLVSHQPGSADPDHWPRSAERTFAVAEKAAEVLSAHHSIGQPRRLLAWLKSIRRTRVRRELDRQEAAIRRGSIELGPNFRLQQAGGTFTEGDALNRRMTLVITANHLQDPRELQLVRSTVENVRSIQKLQTELFSNDIFVVGSNDCGREASLRSEAVETLRSQLFENRVVFHSWHETAAKRNYAAAVAAGTDRVKLVSSSSNGIVGVQNSPSQRSSQASLLLRRLEIGTEPDPVKTRPWRRNRILVKDDQRLTIIELDGEFAQDDVLNPKKTLVIVSDNFNSPKDLERLLDMVNKIRHDQMSIKGRFLKDIIVVGRQSPKSVKFLPRTEQAEKWRSQLVQNGVIFHNMPRGDKSFDSIREELLKLLSKLDFELSPDLPKLALPRSSSAPPRDPDPFFVSIFSR